MVWWSSHPADLLQLVSYLQNVIISNVKVDVGLGLYTWEDNCTEAMERMTIINAVKVLDLLHRASQLGGSNGELPDSAFYNEVIRQGLHRKMQIFNHTSIFISAFISLYYNYCLC